jgi:periplasmic divalent cation tolerance protein
MGDTHFHLVFSTFPAGDDARNAAEQLVHRGLAACVNIVPEIHSVYRWAGTVESGSEQLLIIKSRADRYQALQQALCALHPYELPEIVAVGIEDGLPAYLRWLSDGPQPKADPPA